MTKGPITIVPQDTAEHAVLLMDAAGIDHLPVCDGKRLVGLVARTELLERVGKLLSRRPSPEQIHCLLPYVQVAGVMRLDPPQVPPEATLADAAATMHSVGLTALAVVAGGELVGILTERDAGSPLGESARSQGAGR